ncbi:hypothetical protein CBR_g57044 [Chara braunii]|uniref:Uncharacterized protein n=1 Tax=Chara braunii TaxID=69332 RepID=A0A388K7X6_CHABU|nr:hypothetical protein CBR_g57044 [Chara braunii]|eukprot:GBG66162.1 hypothetical protein CBR_g57044 [Chara braunii]
MRALDKDYVVGQLEDVLDNLLTTRRCDMELSMEEERQVKNVALDNIRRLIMEYHLRHMHIAAESINNDEVRKEIEWLTGRYLVCPTDKAPHTPTFVCINFIRKLELERLSGPDFVPLQQQPDKVSARLLAQATTFASARHFEDRMPLPHLMTVYKAHKESFRWITNPAGSVLSHIADIYDCLPKFLAVDVQALCASRSDKVMAEHDVRPNYWWPITSLREFVANLPQNVYSIYADNITRCFEAIPTDNSDKGLISVIRFFVQTTME